jgi:hypothetical protein
MPNASRSPPNSVPRLSLMASGGEATGGVKYGHLVIEQASGGLIPTAGGPTPKIGAGTGTQQTMKPIGAGASTITGAGRTTLTSVGYGYRGGNGLLLG